MGSKGPTSELLSDVRSNPYLHMSRPRASAGMGLTLPIMSAVGFFYGRNIILYTCFSLNMLKCVKSFLKGVVLLLNSLLLCLTVNAVEKGVLILVFN